MTGPMHRRLEAEEIVVVNDVEYRLRFDFNVMADFEDRTGGRDLLSALSPEEGQTPSAIDLRLIFELCLQEYHVGTDTRAAGRIYSADPDSLTRLLARAFPAPVTADEASAASDGEDDAGKQAAARAA